MATTREKDRLTSLRSLATVCGGLAGEPAMSLAGLAAGGAHVSRHTLAGIAHDVRYAPETANMARLTRPGRRSPLGVFR